MPGARAGIATNRPGCGRSVAIRAVGTSVEPSGRRPSVTRQARLARRHLLQAPRRPRACARVRRHRRHWRLSTAWLPAHRGRTCPPCGARATTGQRGSSEEPRSRCAARVPGRWWPRRRADRQRRADRRRRADRQRRTSPARAADHPRNAENRPRTAGPLRAMRAPPGTRTPNLPVKSPIWCVHRAPPKSIETGSDQGKRESRSVSIQARRRSSGRVREQIGNSETGDGSGGRGPPGCRAT